MNPVSDIVEMQAVLKKIVTGSVRWLNDEQEVIDIPAREVAQCSVAFVKLEAQRRINLGKANPAPVKSLDKPRGERRSIPAVRPVPEPTVAPEPGQPARASVTEVKPAADQAV